MSLSHKQLSTIGTVGRVCSVLSILGIFTIIGGFIFSRHFRSPIHRIIFFNSFYNLADSIATMISVSGPEAGGSSSLCQFQGFALQMYEIDTYSFPLADVLWTFAMALDTYLVVFHHFDAESLRKLEIKYVGIITGLTFIPALVFLFIHTSDRGFIIAISMLFYCLIGIEISRLRDEFKLTEDDHIALTSAISGNNPSLDNSNATTTTNIEANPQKNPGHISESNMASDSSTGRITTTTRAPPFNSNPIPLTHKPPKQRRVSFKQYILMPSLFFLALLATWVTPTINRVSSFIRHDHLSYSLLVAVSALGSLRGLWNGIIFITIGMKGWRRRAWEWRIASRKVSQTLRISTAE
ncbi:hypothetical protein NUU61_002684 [Penicillium alfredii]|uniref:Uncharacterized protein n=1 Tax=Penicillium alfredii TaxID=1506179 RepID=A0A9W9FT08_9EURO|nr:uncharacterized protein NUU61_002684 [Penicillium alfredii]KAJ5105337.1 hypothetical protein NUU61_002684 [Penicillium alfredii]